MVIVEERLSFCSFVILGKECHVDMTGKASTKAKNKYNAANYDNLRIVIPKGRKRAVEACAKQRGESVNGLVNALLRAEMGLSDDEWRQTDET